MPTADSPLQLQVVRRELHTPQIVVLELAAADGRALPPFEAGAHVELHLGGGLVRPYSLCGDPADRSRYRLGVLLDPATRGGSRAVHRDLLPGAGVAVGTPRNLFPLAADARYSVLVGGGIGITPMIAMAHALQAAGRGFELHYCTRSPAQAAFLAELRDGPLAARARLYHDEGGARFDPRAQLPEPAKDVHVYVCGPAGFMDWVIDAARAAGHDAARIHREYFSVEVDSGGGAFEVELARSGKVVAVAAGQSIAAALAAAGTRVQVSCEEGVCGTCLTDVLAGIPDHRDVYLTDEEKAANDQILLCCSRSRSSRLVLDL
ncbi:PDR/VanB family oxidoreductase [Stenotrophomonas sp. MMGLT7]|uniref:PDR/VanB family oxidoreductase n=1 Tax=Stenotrophomonas sp. MMGLT7 TaxID=2901227 RepID=UPI001E4DD80E|nr:PDR/VanB family oxidoreductase [Stenotrophomonas sp. MMGLT7]MCD7098784.1 PDR/VanB family oxidoreductase [Stenotrophomonas sp. MMGLT7]